MTDRFSFSPSSSPMTTPAGSPVGVSLKTQHFAEVLAKKPSVAFFEVHAENFMSGGGAHHRYLAAISEHYPISVHGVGMSLGSAAGLSHDHLKKFKRVVDRYDPLIVSEHLAWSSEGGFYLNDLLPLPLNAESVKVVSDNIDQMQNAIGRKILVENPSAYMAFTETDIPEPEYLTMLAENTGCGILLDVNNVYVSGANMNWSAAKYLAEIPADLVGEVHLAGHTLKDLEDGVQLRIDDHGSPVDDAVWEHFKDVTGNIGARPTLIEWDTNIPAFDVLVMEAEKASAIIASIASKGLGAEGNG